MEEKKQRARAAVIRDKAERSGCDIGESINDAANSVAESYEEYMEICNYLLCAF